jgi:hypothetical protein
MGLPFMIAAIAATNLSRLTATTTTPPNPNRRVPPEDVQKNVYGDKWREPIIRSVIRRARPTWMFGWFNICPLNDVRDMLGIEFPGNDAYRLLDSFHCVGYYGIPREIRRRLPQLIREALTPRDKEGK